MGLICQPCPCRPHHPAQTSQLGPAGPSSPPTRCSSPQTKNWSRRIGVAVSTTSPPSAPCTSSGGPASAALGTSPRGQVRLPEPSPGAGLKWKIWGGVASRGLDQGGRSFLGQHCDHKGRWRCVRSVAEEGLQTWPCGGRGVVGGEVMRGHEWAHKHERAFGEG